MKTNKHWIDISILNPFTIAKWIELNTYITLMEGLTFRLLSWLPLVYISNFNQLAILSNIIIYTYLLFDLSCHLSWISYKIIIDSFNFPLCKLIYLLTGTIISHLVSYSKFSINSSKLQWYRIKSIELS